jgi:hypothetical protein
MPVLFTFDIRGAPPPERRRVQSFLERFGWENIGGSSYRYPRRGTRDQPVEDWLNHVVPALMLFRCYILSSGRQLPRFTIDVQSSVGFNEATQFGLGPKPGTGVRRRRPRIRVKLYKPTTSAFGEKKLRNWLESVAYPY